MLRQAGGERRGRGWRQFDGGGADGRREKKENK